MAGRGRGRGGGNTLSFNIEALGIQRGELSSTPIQQPPPLFPPLQTRTLPLLETDALEKNLLDIKQEMHIKRRQSPYFVTLEEKKRDIERYSDKYQLNNQDTEDKWTPDWRLFPAELKPTKKRKMKSLRPNLKAARIPGIEQDVLSTLENAEKNATAEDEEKEGEEDEEEKEQVDEEAEVEEEEEEEETDYNLTYFDNGEGYGDDEEEEDEPSYS